MVGVEVSLSLSLLSCCGVGTLHTPEQAKLCEQVELTWFRRIHDSTRLAHGTKSPEAPGRMCEALVGRTERAQLPLQYENPELRLHHQWGLLSDGKEETSRLAGLAGTC